MKKHRTHQGGYIGLIVLVVSVAIIAILFSRMYFTKEKQSEEESLIQPQTASGTAPTTKIESYHADINAAGNLKKILDEKSRATDTIQ